MMLYSLFYEDEMGRDRLAATFTERWEAASFARDNYTDRPRMIVEWQMLNASEVESYDAEPRTSSAEGK